MMKHTYCPDCKKFYDDGRKNCRCGRPLGMSHDRKKHSFRKLKKNMLSEEEHDRLLLKIRIFVIAIFLVLFYLSFFTDFETNEAFFWLVFIILMIITLIGIIKLIFFPNKVKKVNRRK